MILLKADATIKAAFNKTISVMGADVEWMEVFMVNNNNIILPGKRRSLVFSFDNKRVTNTIMDIDVNIDRARLMCDNNLLENAFNILLYVFGKWNQIKGLTVGQNYNQLKKIIENVFSQIKVTVDISKDRCRFYSNGIQLTYEDVIQLILDGMRNSTVTEDVESTADKENEVQKENTKKAPKKSKYKMGLWHKIVWKSDEKTFKYSNLLRKERSKKRLGRGFYASAYICPVCGEILYMIVYPIGKELRIETDEEPVYLSRAYTCENCKMFFTPRPHTLLAEGSVYKLDFDDDEQAYDDYIDLIGKEGGKFSNCNFNVYESEYEQKTSEQIEFEEKERERSDTEFLDDICKDINSHSDSEIFQLNERMEAEFYSERNVKKYGSKIENETKKRNLKAGDIKKFFKEHFNFGDQNMKNVPQKSNIIDNSYKKNTDNEITDANGKTTDSDNVKMIKRMENSKKLISRAINGDDRGFVTDTASLSEQEIIDLSEDIKKDVQLEENVREKYVELSKKILEKKQEKDIAQQVIEVKNKDFEEMSKVYESVSKKNCADHIKLPMLNTLFEWMKARKEKELSEFIKSIPEEIDREQYEYYKQKLKKYDVLKYKNSQNEDDILNEKAARHKDNYVDFIENRWKQSQMKKIAQIIGNNNSVREVYRLLKDENLDEDVVNPYLEELYSKIKELDTIAIEELCPDLANMSYDEAVTAYEAVSEGDFLPELKIDMLQKITDHINELKKEECQSLVKKFQKDIAYNDNYTGLYLYDVNENPYEVQNALYSYVQLRQFEYPIAICDVSRGSNGKKGFVLTPDHIYYSCGLSSGVLDIRTIDDVYLEKGILSKGIYAECHDVGKIKISGMPKFLNGDNDILTFIDAFKEFIIYLKEKPESRNIQYLVEQKHQIICCVRCGYVFDSNKGNICPKCGSVNEISMLDEEEWRL